MIRLKYDDCYIYDKVPLFVLSIMAEFARSSQRRLKNKSISGASTESFAGVEIKVESV